MCTRASRRWWPATSRRSRRVRMKDSDQVCHNEEVWYQPLVKLDHAMPAYTTGNAYDGNALGETWNYPEKRGSFVGTFSYQD